MASARVPGFLPSTCGFRFANVFRPQPLIRVPLAGLGSVRIGDASRGLCGGMVFAARDYFERGCPPPADGEPPEHGSPLFGYLVRRLFQSFHLPWGPLRYYRWMAAPDDVLLRHTVRREWPRVRRELDAGRLAALGLIRPRSRNPLRLGENHQVLAYGYGLDEPSGSLLIAIYDPNYPGRDDVTLALSLREPDGLLSVTGEPFRGFFHTGYRPARNLLWPSRI
ncbi:MAG TPA: hypothetical protein VFA26_11815 [Gemmataceae bacterium]|nr:hypothetical protein [Gemmataceae bacterium]